MIDRVTVKLCLAILGQSIIDAYRGTGKVRSDALAWFRNDYPELVEILKDRGIRFRYIFSFSDRIMSWYDVRTLIHTNPAAVYLNCRVVQYMEGVVKEPLLADDKYGIRIIRKEQGGRPREPVQLLHPTLVKIA